MDNDGSSVSTSRSLTLGPDDNKLASPPSASASAPARLQPEPCQTLQLPKVDPEAEAQDPPPFASHNFPSLYFPVEAAPPPDFDADDQGPSSSASSACASVVEATKAALPCDTKPASHKAPDDEEPPPPYNEGASPLDGFTYLMAQAGGAASIITQVSQGGPAPINTFHTSSDEHINLDLRCAPSFLLHDSANPQPEAPASPSHAMSSSPCPSSSCCRCSPTACSPTAT